MSEVWATVRLGEVADIERSSIPPSKIAPGTSYVGLEHIERTGEIRRRSPVEAGELASAKFKFTEQHVLYGKLRPNLGKIARPDFSGVCSTDIVPLMPGPRIDRHYLYHFLRQPTIVNYASSQAVGVNLPRLSPSVLAKFEIPLPPIAEQRRIAAVLDKADDLRARRSAMLGRLRSLTEALFLDVLLEGGRDGWPRAAISSLAASSPNSMRTGPFGSQLLHSEFVDDGVAVLGIDNVVSNAFRWGRPRFVTEEKYQQLRRYTVRPGDLLVTILGTCGRAAVVPEDIPTAINTKHLFCITLDLSKCLPRWLWACLQFDPVTLHQLGVSERGAVMPGLNMKLIKETLVPLPPMDVQQEFARRLAEVDSLRSGYEVGEALVDELFESLRQRAFTGVL